MATNENSLMVYEVMSFPIVTAYEDDDLKSVAVKMLKYRVGSVIITDRLGTEKGIITQGDIARFFAVSDPKGRPYRMQAKGLMSAPLVCIDGEEDLEAAARLMVAKKVKKLCVIDAEKKLAGIITDNDIMKNTSSLIGILVNEYEGYLNGIAVAEALHGR